MRGLLIFTLSIAIVVSWVALDASAQEKNNSQEWPLNSGAKIKRDALYVQYTNALAQVAKESQKKHESALGRYEKKLDALLTAARVKGDFDGYNAIKQEADRLRAERTLAMDSKSPTAELTLASSECQKELTAVDTQKEGLQGEVTKKYIGVLQELVKTLVVQKKIEEATIINNEIKALSEKLVGQRMDATTGKNESKPPRKKIEASPWKDITGTFEGVKKQGLGFVLKGNQIATKAKYRPPVEIEYECKTDSKSLKISYACSELIFNWPQDMSELHITGGMACLKHVPGKGSIPANQFVKIRQVVFPDSMEIYVDDELRGSWEGDFSEIEAPIEVCSPRYATLSTITVKSVHIRVPAPKVYLEKLSIPSEAKEYKGHHYLVVDKYITWANARFEAEKLGGHLVTIRDKNELDFVSALILQGDKSPYGGEIRALVGAFHENERWQWLDGTSVDSSFWMPKYKSQKAYGSPGANLDVKNGLVAFPRHAKYSRYVIEWDE
jgi:hypothetical protein